MSIRALRSAAPARWLAALVTVMAALAGCGSGGGEADGAQAAARPLPPTPSAYQAGERLYDTNCAGCHGQAGRGTAQGPPLVHQVYEPGHHSDAAFLLAARNGVVAHHWRFGNMPPQPQVDDAAVREVIAYVRWLQREAGIR